MVDIHRFLQYTDFMLQSHYGKSRFAGGVL